MSLYNYLKFINEPQIDENLWKSGFFCGDFQSDKGAISRTLSELGYTPRDMMDGTYISNIHPDDVNAHRALFDRLHAGKDDYFICEYRLKDSAGNWKWILTQAFVIKRNAHHNICKVIGFDRDITLQKQAEEFYHKGLINSRFSNNSKSSTIEKIMKNLRQIVDFDFCSVYIKDDEVHGFSELIQYPEVENPCSIEDESLLHSLASERNPLIIDKYVYKPDHSFLLVPLHIDSNYFGFTLLGHRSKDYYMGKDCLPIKSFTEYFSLQVISLMESKTV